MIHTLRIKMSKLDKLFYIARKVLEYVNCKIPLVLSFYSDILIVFGILTKFAVVSSSCQFQKIKVIEVIQHYGRSNFAKEPNNHKRESLAL